MERKLLSIACLFLFCTSAAFAQTGELTGTVTDADNEPLPGVNIFIPELERGSATGANGEFQISDIEYGTYTLRATYVGFQSYEEQITIDQPTTEIEISLQSDLARLDDVVVTAFGLAREERSLSYSVQEVSGEDLDLAAETDLVGSLAGKISGIQVIGSPGAALGGTQRIRIRGLSGLSTSNPLFVVDGTPISNENFNLNDRDYGNLAQDLNLDDIQSVSVLKGASAAALYGNRASDGVIVVQTKGGETGERPIQVDFSNETTFDRVYKLPDYQNQYAGGYSQNFIEYEDPEDGQVYNGLNYAADESWGPPIEGQQYRPWWSWFHGDFTGDGQDDYGTTIPLEAHPNNVRNFYETGARVSNSLAIGGGTENSSYRVSIEDFRQSGVVPNSSLDKTFLNFNGTLEHADRLTSRVSFNYVNTQGQGRPTQSYSPLQGSPTQMFNQWFQRQLDMDMLKNYQLEDGTFTSWNIRSNTNLRPLYWDSPYFSIYENVPNDDRDRIYGNYTLAYDVFENLTITGKVHADIFDLSTEDRIATGGLETDWFRVTQRNRREMNYELNAQYQQDFQDFSFDGLVGANLRQERGQFLSEETVGGLSVANLYNIDASFNRPDVENETTEKDVRSVYATANVGWQDMLYADVTLRNDWSSALPVDNNSYLYYGVSGSFVFTELDVFDDTFLTFGKLRASMAQVGSDLDPYQIYTRYQVQTTRGSFPAMEIPTERNNPDLNAAISTDYELGLDLRFLDGRLRLDGTYYENIIEDEILNLAVSSTSGYDNTLINAGKFTKTGLEFQFGGTPVETGAWNVDMTLNWSTILTNKVNELAPQLNSRLLEQPTFFIGGSSLGLYAREGEEWGKIVSPGYLRHEETGEPIFNPNTGGFAFDSEVDHGAILPDWNGGFRLDMSYQNFTLGAFLEFQKGGQFYSITKMFNNYAGLGAETVGNNVLGNPMRDPVVDQNGDSQTAVPLDQAGENSGGILVEGVDQDGNQVEYLSQPIDYFYTEFLNNERYIYDASYAKLRSVSLSYSVPTDVLETLPIARASLTVHAQNPWLIYSSVDDIDPSIIQEGGTGFGWWEGGTVPGTRSLGFSVNLGF